MALADRAALAAVEVAAALAMQARQAAMAGALAGTAFRHLPPVAAAVAVAAVALGQAAISLSSTAGH